MVCKTAIGFNPRHKLHYNTINVDHPEHPNRIDEIRKRLEVVELLEECQLFESFPSIDSTLLEKVHSRTNLSDLQKLKSMGQDEINKHVQEFDSVNMAKGSFEAALEGAACAVHLTQLLIEDKIDNGFAVIRPPGHHAQHAFPNGFCLLNNVALAAKQAESMGVERILIIDFDVHHGQGTQYQFYESKNVLYFSTHRYEHGAFWPYLRESDFDYTGSGEGKGYNVNVPINEPGVEDADFMHIFWTILYPIACELKPQLILYSAGFDSCGGDPVGQFNLTPNLYASWLYHLQPICSKQLLVLEGGYNHRVQAVCVQRCIEVLRSGLPNIEIGSDWKIRQSTVESCNNLLHTLQPYWTSLNQSQNPNVKSSYALPTSPPANTGDIHQHELPFPFGTNEFEKRLEKLRIELFFESKEKMEMSKFKLDSIIQKRSIGIRLLDQLDNLSLFTNNHNTSTDPKPFILVSSQIDLILSQITHDINRPWLKLEQMRKNALFRLSVEEKKEKKSDGNQVHERLTIFATVLKTYQLLTNENQPKLCFIKIEKDSFEYNVWRLVWHLQTIRQLKVVVVCDDFARIDEELQRTTCLFNEYFN